MKRKLSIFERTFFPGLARGLSRGFFLIGYGCSMAMMIGCPCSDAIAPCSEQAGWHLSIRAEQGSIRPGVYTVSMEINQMDLVEISCEVVSSQVAGERCQIEKDADTPWLVRAWLDTDCDESCMDGSDKFVQDAGVFGIHVNVQSVSEESSKTDNYIGPERVEVLLNMDGESEDLGSAEFHPSYHRTYNNGHKVCGWCEVAMVRGCYGATICD